MASGTIYGHTSNQYIEVKIEWSTVVINEQNKSIVYADLYYRRNNTGYVTAGRGSFSIQIDDWSSTVTKSIRIETEWVKAHSAYKIVTHNPNGSKKVIIQATGKMDETTLGYTICWEQVTLDTISRASTITSAYDVNLGNSCKITWTPLATSFYYKLEFTCGSWSATTDAFCPGTTSVYTYTGYVFPYEVAEQFPSSTNGVMNVTLYTYSDSGITQVGSASTSAFFVYLPENKDTKPQVVMSLSPVTPYEKFASLYLRGISKVKATFSGEGKYKATVDSYSMEIDGKSYPSPYESDIITTSGEVTVVGTGKDSRGFTNTDTKTITVIEYEAPYILPYNGYNRVICERCTEDGTADDSGTYLHVKGTRNYTKINTNGIVNTCSVKCRYKPEGGNWSHGIGEGVSVLRSDDTASDEFDIVLPDINLDPAVIYTVELNIVDDANIIKAMEFSIPSEYVDFEFREGGKGIGLGKHATEVNLLDCDWNAKFRKNLIIGDDAVTDFVLAEGTDGIWYYRKWHSGKVECWGRSSVSVNISEPWGAIYYGSVDSYAYPSGLFTSAPMCQVTAEFGSTLQAAWLCIAGASTIENAPAVWFCRPMVEENAGFDILYYAIGTWK